MNESDGWLSSGINVRLFWIVKLTFVLTPRLGWIKTIEKAQEEHPFLIQEESHQTSAQVCAPPNVQIISVDTAISNNTSTQISK